MAVDIVLLLNVTYCKAVNKYQRLEESATCFYRYSVLLYKDYIVSVIMTWGKSIIKYASLVFNVCVSFGY